MRRRTWVWSRFLVLADALFGSHLLEWELARRQRRIERLTNELLDVDRDLEAAARALDFYQITFCLILLKTRSERAGAGDWLSFDTRLEGDEDVLNSVIECLVKTHLARLDVLSSESGHQVYRLVPDWSAIMAHFDQRILARELQTWLRQQLPSGDRDEL
jgi:hypothetical protein